MTKFILYACPTGPLYDQIDHYFRQAKRTIGPNPAHDYMPHCSLTGFFTDAPNTAKEYVAALDTLVTEMTPTKPIPTMTITNVHFDERFHGFELESSWLRALAVAFAERAQSPTRQETIRTKEWLHVSFAYQFAPADHGLLVHLARELIDPSTSVDWEVVFYERTVEETWVCHATWPL